jgi:hypothetical protein
VTRSPSLLNGPGSCALLRSFVAWSYLVDRLRIGLRMGLQPSRHPASRSRPTPNSFESSSTAGAGAVVEMLRTLDKLRIGLRMVAKENRPNANT